MKGIRYMSVDEVTPKTWMIQGTVYDTSLDAKMAAAKLWCSLTNDGVVVKKVANGWTCFWWRRK